MLVSAGWQYRGVELDHHGDRPFDPTNDCFGERGEASRGLCRYFAPAHRVDAQLPTAMSKEIDSEGYCRVLVVIIRRLQLAQKFSEGALRRRIPVTLRRPSIVTPKSFLPIRMAVGKPY